MKLRTPQIILTLISAKKSAERKVKNAAVILYDIGTKQERKDWVEDFKDGKFDLLFVLQKKLEC